MKRRERSWKEYTRNWSESPIMRQWGQLETRGSDEMQKGKVACAIASTPCFERSIPAVGVALSMFDLKQGRV